MKQKRNWSKKKQMTRHKWEGICCIIGAMFMLGLAVYVLILSFNAFHIIRELERIATVILAGGAVWSLFGARVEFKKYQKLKAELGF